MNESSLSEQVGPEHRDSSRIAWGGIPANPEGATHARMELAEWLQSHVAMNGERSCDVVLAVYEALANAAEASMAPDSTTDVNAVYDADRRTLSVSVIDHGEWRAPSRMPATPTSLQRGRGIPLMRALADHVRIDIGQGGTTVALTWNEVASLAPDAP